MKKVIITGATGFIGGALAKKLLSDGVKVYGVGRNAEKLNQLKEYGDFVPVVADFEQYGALHEMIAETDFDVLYHLAWQGATTASYEDYSVQTGNIKAACEIAYAAAKWKCGKIVFISTNRENLVSCGKTDAEAHKCSIYGITKTAAKSYISVISHISGLEYNSAIFSNVFGVGDQSLRSTNFFIRQLQKGEDLNLIEGKNLNDWLYIDDAVEGLVSVGGKGINGKEYYIGNRTLRPFREIVTELRDTLNPDSKLNFGAYTDMTFFDYSKYDIYALYNDTGFIAKADFKESIIKTANWLKSINERSRT
jgi:nucleoside-diphosphate-sugar epimerase